MKHQLLLYHDIYFISPTICLINLYKKRRNKRKKARSLIEFSLLLCATFEIYSEGAKKTSGEL